MLAEEQVEFASVKARAKEKLRRDMGTVMESALNDPHTVEIMLNADGKLWQEKLGDKMQCIGTLSATRAEALIKTVAGYHGKEVTRFKPTIEGVFPLDGSRFAGQLPPVVAAPTFAIRKKALKIFTLDHYVSNHNMTATQAAVIKTAIQAHRNILISGGTGSGKTTLVNAIIEEMVRIYPTERIFVIEDTGEIQCTAQNTVQYYTTLEVSLTALLKTTLRMRPDRIIVGEVRGAEALDLLDAWNTGHEGGAATLHANNSQAALTRLHSLITRNPSAPRDIAPLIGEAVHLIIQIARGVKGPHIQEILTVSGYKDGHYILQPAG